MGQGFRGTQVGNHCSGLLTKIGNGEELNPAERACIEDRFRSREDCATIAVDAIRLFHRNVDVDEYTHSVIAAQWNSIAVDTYSGHTEQSQLISARTYVHRSPTSKTGNLPYNLPLALGKSYMITCNLSVEDGMVNGAIGILRHVDLKFSEDASGDGPTSAAEPHCLWLEFIDSSEAGRLTRSKCRPLVTSRAELDRSWTPLYRKKVSFPVTKIIKCARVHFPLSPAVALTTHKSQGATFNRVVSD